ncbi:MAG: hypothetical protein II966_02175 [Lachnospiraceae bacterium]|nr:hypothetical protein [Lachnospiraceae bacterium]
MKNSPDGTRVMLMTRMASFEDNEGKEAIRICNYFRSDYVCLNVLRAVVSATVSFFLVLVLYVYYDIDRLLQEIYTMDLMAMGRKLVTAYVIFAGAFGIIAYVVYSFRFDWAKKHLNDYNYALRELQNIQEVKDNG